MNREILIKRLVNRTLNAKHNAGWVVAPVVCFFSIAPKTGSLSKRAPVTLVKS